MVIMGTNWSNEQSDKNTPKPEGSLEVRVKVGFLDVL